MQEVVRSGKKADFCPISNRVATLALRVGGVNIGLLGCYAPTESFEDNGAKEFFYELVAKTYDPDTTLSTSPGMLWYYLPPWPKCERNRDEA